MNDMTFILSIVINIMLTIIVLLFFYKLRKVEKRYYNFISKFDKKGNIEDILNNYIEMVNIVNEDNKIMHANFLALEKQLNRCVQKMGMVRYNAFDDVGSDLSFALAILNNENNGVIINAIYARTSNNVYAKPIENGTSRYSLSEEEIKAIAIAKEQ